MARGPRSLPSFKKRDRGSRFVKRGNIGLHRAIDQFLVLPLKKGAKVTCTHAQELPLHSQTNVTVEAMQSGALCATDSLQLAKKKAVKTAKGWATTKYGFRSGMKNGLKVHACVERLAKRISGELSSKRRMRLDTQSHAIVRVLEKEKLMPTAAEVPVHWNDAGVSTRVDLVCGKSVVEIKTGYSDAEFTRPKYVLHHNLLPDTGKPCVISERDRAFIQLYCESVAYQRTAGVMLEEEYLVHSPYDGTAHLYKIPTWVLALGPAIQAQLARNAAAIH